jgi:opacity protein-like surface antigen
MKKTIATVLLLVASVAILSPQASATDRDARQIDWIGFQSAAYDDARQMSGVIWSETRTAAAGGKWSILLGGSLGALEPDGMESDVCWSLGLGVKRYLCDRLSLALLGGYEQFPSYEDDPDTVSLTIEGKLRLIPATEATSPFVLAALSGRDVGRTPLQPGADESFRECLLTLGAGVDFMMNEELAIVFEGSYNNASNVSGDGETPDFWLCRVSMKYYFE